MSYRVDIPTLSANEVYTLTFEYEGTETIQLIVGDLTLETTDRRVVFTTTSPVNYIESNVNLTNLNIYEGYYESDDFGGEYTQESYIEGKSLINIFPPSSPKTLVQGHSLDFDETTGLITITFVNNTNNFNCTARAYGLMKYLKPSTDYTFVIDILENSLVDADGNASTKPLYFFNTSAYVSPNTQQPFIGGSSKGDVVKNGTPTIEGSVGRYLCGIRTVDTFLDTMSADMVLYTVAHNGTLKAKIMVLEGDYTESGIEANWFPQGIGCVKSPTIISHEDSNNLFYIKDYTCTVNGGTVYSRNGKISFSGYFWTYTNIDIIKGGVDNKPNCYYEPGTYYLKAHYKTIKPRPNNDTYTANFVFVCADGTTKELIGMPNVRMGGTCNTVQQDTLTVTSPIVKIYYKIWYGGTRDWITIENVSISKVNREYTQGEEDNAILETSVVSTPDDLELHSFIDVWDNKTIADSLDLTTGIVTKNVGILDITDINTLVYSGYDSTNDLYNVSCSFANFPNIVTKGNDTLVTSNILERKWYTAEGLFSHGVGGKFEFRISGTRGITSGDEAKQWVIDNLIIFYERTPEIIQLDINVLKSYYNGSITTSSQQLTPTLKTTLPISNKFTTTNLTSGQMYNIYFDGTATKLDAGGTIITDPVSPCEVECGGTTLTIEGTDIQNVRVIETSVKNEVGNNSTSDVELAKIVSYEHNNIASNVRYSKNSYAYQCSVKLDNTNHSFTISGGHNSSHGSVNTGINYPSGISLVHIACDITMPSENLMANIHFGNGVWNSYQNFQNVTLNNDTATIKQTTQRFNINNSYKDFFSTVVTGGHYSNLMYVVSKNNVQTDESFIITVFTMAAQTLEGYTGVGSNGVTISNLRVKVLENYPNITTLDNVTSVLRENDGSTIIWEDMDLTFIQNVSKLEQPIKLRSLGTTYDSYNPVTGELVKRIGVSETDGSYSVLSSPIVISPKYKMLQDNNIMPNSFPQTMNSAYIDFLPTQLLPNTTYTVFLDATTAVGQLECGLLYNGDWYDGVKHFTVGVNRFIYTTGNDINGYYSNTGHRGFRIRGWGSIINNLIMVQGEYSLDYYYPIIPPHLYTNGQVKVYSNSDVYPTTILNGQSTNNYEVNELNKSNNYTIRYDGECESINLNGKSNEQGTNRIVKTSTNGGGNLTFVNDNGDIDNVLLVQNDVREQKIKHFNGLQTVEVSRILIENQRNMSSQHYIFENGSHYDYQRILPHYIKVEPNETLYVNIGQNWMDWCTIYQYDEDKNRLSDIGVFGGYGTTQFKDSDGLYKNIITLSDNTHYIRIVLHNAFTSTFTLSRGDFLPPSTLAYNQYQGQFIDLPQPVQLNSLLDGTHDTYNPITGEYVQNVGVAIMDENGSYGSNWSNTGTVYPVSRCTGFTIGDMASTKNTVTNVLNNMQTGGGYGTAKDYEVKLHGWGNKNTDYRPVIDCGNLLTSGKNNINGLKAFLKENPIILYYQLVTPIVTQLTPITIPTFESGILQLITTDGKVFPMVEYSMPTNNRYDTSSWETGVVYTQRNITEAYFNESATPMIPTETMTLTTDHISSGSIILNDNGNGLIVLKGNYTGRDIPYFTGMRSVEAIEVETTPSPDQPLFGKGGRK